MFLSLRTATLELILAFAAIAIISLAAQAGDPLNGTWEPDLAKSKFINVPPPKSETRTYEMTGQHEKIDCETNRWRGDADAKGQPWESISVFGKRWPPREYSRSGSVAKNRDGAVDALLS